MTKETEAEKKAVLIQIWVTISLTVTTIIGGMTFFHWVEKLSWLDTWYFVIITLTTVGYGDISPQTSLGKLVTPIFILVGIGLITSFITGFNKLIVKHRTKKIVKHRNTKKTKV